MSRKAKMTLVVLTALNAIALIINVSLPTRAAVAGKTYNDLISDPDFTRAVQSIAQKCRVNVDIARLECGSFG
jgi:hypothetical protein